MNEFVIVNLIWAVVVIIAIIASLIAIGLYIKCYIEDEWR